MEFPIIISVTDDKLIDVINFMDSKDIKMDIDEDELFEELVHHRRFNEIEFFLDRGSEPQKFMQFCTDDDKDIINFLVERNNDISENSGDFLISLINSCNFESIKLLLDNYTGDMDEFINYKNGLPLRTAAGKGNEKILKLLFLNGAKISNCITDPLLNALHNNRTHVVPLLIENGSKCKNIGPDDLEICLWQNSKFSLSYIADKLSKNELPKFYEKNLSRCLLLAAKTGYLDILRELINFSNELDDDLLIKMKKHAKSNWVLHYINLLEKNQQRNKKKEPMKKKLKKNNSTFLDESDNSDYESDNSDDDDNEYENDVIDNENPNSSVKISKAGVTFRH